jgi:hypothetical protein
LFEGPLSPFDWGVKEVRGRMKHRRCLSNIEALLGRYQPDILVLQDTSPSGTIRAPRIEHLNAAIATVANGCGMPEAVRKFAEMELLGGIGPNLRNQCWPRGLPFAFTNVGIQIIQQSEAMRAAFYRVCDILQLECNAGDPMTEIVVMKPLPNLV